jgi:predicted transcriptional regulator
MPTKPSIQSFKQFRDVVYSFRLSRIIFTALDLDLFNIMGRRTLRIPQLSKQLHTSHRGLEILCRSLASTGLLVKSQAGYRTSAFATTYLQKSSKEFRGDYLALMQRQWKEWSRLTEVVTSGLPVDNQEPETPKYQIGRAHV